MSECWKGSRCPLLPPSSSFFPFPTSYPGNRAVTLLLTRSESINTLALCALSHGTRAMGDSSVALHPWCPRQLWHMRMGSAGLRGAGSHTLAAAPKVTRQALARSQSVEPRPKIKRQPERRGGNKGRMKREKSRGAFPLSFSHPTVFSLFF